MEISPLLSTACVSSYAIARISNDMKGKLPWAEIWSLQDLPEKIYKALRIAITGCENAITVEAKRLEKLPSEFAKKVDCWTVVAAAKIELGLEGSFRGWDKFSIMDTVRTSAMVEADNIFFSLDKREWKYIARELNQLTENSAYIGCVETMAGYVEIRKKPSERQARIIAKSLLFVRKENRCPEIMLKIPNASWSLLEQIASAARPS